MSSFFRAVEMEMNSFEGFGKTEILSFSISPARRNLYRQHFRRAGEKIVSQLFLQREAKIKLFFGSLKQ